MCNCGVRAHLVMRLEMHLPRILLAVCKNRVTGASECPVNLGIE